jgi:hypothetical protein
MCCAPYESTIVDPSIAIDNANITPRVPLLFIIVFLVDILIKVSGKNHILKNSEF